MSKLDKVSAKLSFSPKYCSAVAKKAIFKTSSFIYHEAICIFLGFKNVVNVVHFWVFK